MLIVKKKKEREKKKCHTQVLIRIESAVVVHLSQSTPEATFVIYTGDAGNMYPTLFEIIVITTTIIIIISLSL